MVPPTFTDQVPTGSATASRTRVRAARWQTAPKPSTALASASRSRRSASARPRVATSCPASARRAATTVPTNPRPPVTSTRTARLSLVGHEVRPGPQPECLGRCHQVLVLVVEELEAVVPAGVGGEDAVLVTLVRLAAEPVDVEGH